MRAYGSSNIGLIRKTNEDAFYYQDNYEKGKPFVCVIADGMGGHNAGEVASKMAVLQFIDFYERNIKNYKNSFNNYAKLVKEAFFCVNKNIYLESIKKPEYTGMGTTLTVVFIIDNKMIIGHVGDSRVYMIRESHIEKITTDHSYVAELIKNGTIKPEEASSHPQKNLITRAIGTSYTIDVDINVYDLKNGDYMIMCTDGLSNMLNQTEIKETVLYDNDLIEKCNALIGLANKKGGHDNITVIIIEVMREV
ncbi:MAG: Stp1/IreP family PP2C-type Ser/Thr phosphatase [Firmicutes bacterium]|nr:Stp1/IreP family PP2C-type Ser/Thr phosphatase [Bacillota bacterium]